MIKIALFQPDIPQNTAATIRLCACLNTTLEIIEPCGFQFDEKRLKSIYMDYYKNCKIIRHQSFDDFTKTKKTQYNITLVKTIFRDLRHRLLDALLSACSPVESAA